MSAKIKDYHITPIFCLVIYVLVFGASYINSGGYTASSFLLSLVVQITVFIIPAVIYKRIKGPIKYGELGIRPFGLNSILFVISASVFMFCAAVLMNLNSSVYISEGALDITSLDASGIIYATVINCLLPAVTEEFVFRSVIYGEYRKFGILSAVIFSSVLFSMMHFSLTSFFTYFLCGVVLALVYEVSRSVFASMAVHFLYNLMSVFSHKLLNEAANRFDNMIPFVFIFGSVMLLFLFFSLSRAQRLLEYDAENIPEEKNEKMPTLQDRARSLLLSVFTPGFLLCLIFAFFAGIMKMRR